MSDADSLSGACLCGKCTFTAQRGPQGSGVCHCDMCKKWSGGMYISTDCGSSVAFAEGSPIGSYKGSEWGERIFCKECGSSILWQTQDGENQHVSIQMFDDPSQFEIDIQLFIDAKPKNYALANETNVMTRAEVFAMFADLPEASQ